MPGAWPDETTHMPWWGWVLLLLASGACGTAVALITLAVS